MQPTYTRSSTVVYLPQGTAPYATLPTQPVTRNYWYTSGDPGLSSSSSSSAYVLSAVLPGGSRTEYVEVPDACAPEVVETRRLFASPAVVPVVVVFLSTLLVTRGECTWACDAIRTVYTRRKTDT